MHTEVKSKESARYEFLRFNGILLSSVVVIWILSQIIPRGVFTIKSKVVLDLIFPLVYFTSFSFIFGGLFLAGDETLKTYLKLFIPYNLLDVGVIAAYTGAIALILAHLIKTIIETIFGIKIISRFIIDLVGLILGRVILLSLIYVYD
jgi:hypothetical protein